MKYLLGTDALDWMVLWIFATISGWIIGVVVVAFIGTYFRLITMQDIVLHAMIVGAFVGLLQWRLALKDNVNKVAWVLAIVFANTFIVISIDFVERHQIIPQIFEYYSTGLCASCDRARLHETWFTGTVLFSLIAGLAAAVPTGIVLFHYTSRPPNFWILGCILAFFVVNFLKILFVVSPDLYFKWSYFIVGPIVVALVSAPFLYATLRESMML